MDSWDYWRLCDEMSVDQAVHLLIGMVPGELDAMSRSGGELLPSSLKRYLTDLHAAQTAVGNALRKQVIAGKLVGLPLYDRDGEQYGYIEGSIDYEASQVDVESLKQWLKSRGVKTGFFFPDISDAPDYLDPSNPRYAPKLAAAVHAWQAVTEPGKKSAKQALEKWLRENAASYGLVDDDGNPINQAIEECSKVANWNAAGGAPKTPST
jgi:hypothetical protein